MKRVHVENDWIRMGVSIHLADVVPDGRGVVHDFSGVTLVTVEARATVPDHCTPLALDNETARALYEALADHFGQSGHDTRALRRDYDDERKRVDRLIAHLTEER